MSRVALITGANGFVGRILAKYLRERDWHVHEAVLPGQPEGPNCFACEITDISQVRKLVSRTDGLTHVFHLAAITFVPLSSSDPATTMQVNVQGTINLLECTRVRHPGARFIYVGSAAVYGSPRTSPVTEEHPLAPREPYAISKAAADHYCEYTCRAHNANVVRMRPFNHSGAGQSDRFVLSNFARQIARIERGELPPVLHVGNIDTARDFLHVDDVIRAYELAALLGKPGEAYNVCSGAGRTIRGALETLRARATVPIEIKQDPSRMRPVDIPEIAGSYEKLQSHTGWAPALPFERILDDLLLYWRAQP
jgi:GDP-4-dehydro-6-deoxy-D-mannose reductase